MKEEASLLVFSKGYIKSYWNYTGNKEVDIFSIDIYYILSVIPLFDTYMIHQTNMMITQGQALEYIKTYDRSTNTKLDLWWC